MEKQRNLGWTTLEEAKKLVDAGLDPNTADMTWIYEYLIEDYNESPYFDIRTTEAEDLPCWSVGGLIGVLPQILDGYELRISKWAVEYVDMHNCCDCYYKWCFADDDLIKCLVETILWLLEEGYIKKG